MGSQEAFSDTDEYVSDPEGFDDVSDEKLLPDILKQKPTPSDSLEAIVICDNVPQVGPEKVEKLKNVLKKLFSKFGTVVTEHMPVDEKEVTKGYMFLEYSSLDEAREAVKMTNGYKLDKNHVFIVNLLSDFDKYINEPDEWTAPEPQPYRDPGNLQSWLLNEECIDQFSMIHEKGDKTAVMLNTSPDFTTVEERNHWTDTYVVWSPLGSYLCTFHVKKGIALWGGERFRQIQKFSHPNVQLVDFSPCERYLVTFSPTPVSRSDTGVAESVIVWDIQTGVKKRGFSVDGAPKVSWPILKWSFDGNFFARLQTDAISVYELPSCGLLDKKSLKLPEVRDFEWSPDANILSYWVPEVESIPARVCLVEIPSRNELRVRNLFNVTDCKLHWQKSGEHLCVKVDRYGKKKMENNEPKYSAMSYNFEIFHLKKKDIPVDTVECKDVITAFAWEPTGSKFAFVHGEAPRICVSIYKTGDKITLLKTLEKRQCNSLFWCPTGQFVILAGLRSMNGVLEFVDTSDMTIMATPQEHFMCTDVEWDPTGRYVTTGVSAWGQKSDHGFWMWSFQGKILSKNAIDGFCQLVWRPRPPSLLTPKMLKDLRRNMKEYNRTFEMQDIRSKSKASKDVLDKRRRLYDEYNSFRQKATDVWRHQKSERLALRQNIDTDELDSHAENFDEETVEFLVSVEETVVEATEE